MIQDLIQAVAYGSGGQERLGRGRRRWVAGALLPRRCCAGEDRIRPSRGCFGPRLGSGACPRHEKPSRVLGGALRGTGRRARRWRRLGATEPAACGAPAATEGYGLRNCVKKVRGKMGWCLPGFKSTRDVGRVVATILGGDARSESGKKLAVRVALDSSGLRGGTNRDQMALRSRAKGQRGLRTLGGEELQRRRDLPPTDLG